MKKIRIVKRTINLVREDIVIDSQTFYVVQTRKWFWPLWKDEGYDDVFQGERKFDTKEEAEVWIENNLKKTKMKVIDVVLD